MTNDQFRADIADKIDAANKTLKNPDATPEQKAAAKDMLKMLEDVRRMGTFNSGQAFRRFRRDYERRLAKQGRKRS